MNDTIIFKDESYRLMGACFEVYKEKGHGFLEAVYQECLAMELESQRIPFREQPRLGLKYKGQDLAQFYEPDFLCFGKIIIEIKAVKQLAGEHRAPPPHSDGGAPRIAVRQVRSSGGP